jgi:hypothetical protein
MTFELKTMSSKYSGDFVNLVSKTCVGGKRRARGNDATPCGVARTRKLGLLVVTPRAGD